MNDILNFHPEMHYCRFGKTERKLSAITLGGMRYIHNWEKPKEIIPDAMIDECTRIVKGALAAGINHIETAHGYCKSEKCYGIVLNEVLKLPRQRYYLMTKGLEKTKKSMYKTIEEQLDLLKTDYFDFYALHGINRADVLAGIQKPDGPLNALISLKNEGVIKHIGFSTHAPLDVIIKTINMDVFDFVNLHYYYFFQRNWPAIELANSKDMGVFIISPNDKGGQLFKPSKLVKTMTAPLTPIQWNARFCLKDPAVQTLSFGMTHEKHIDEMRGCFINGDAGWNTRDQKILENMDAQLARDPFSGYLPYELENHPSGLNIPEILRMRRMWKCYDMEHFGVYRYNMFEPDDHWVPGKFATADLIAQIGEDEFPADIPLKELLAESHRKFYREKRK